MATARSPAVRLGMRDPAMPTACDSVTICDHSVPGWRRALRQAVADEGGPDIPDAVSGGVVAILHFRLFVLNHHHRLLHTWIYAVNRSSVPLYTPGRESRELLAALS